MPSSRAFHDGVVERARIDGPFRRELLREAVDAMLNGEFEVAHLLVQDYSRAADYLGEVAAELGLEEGVSELFDPDVNAAGIHLFKLLNTMLQQEGLALAVRRPLNISRRPMS